MGCFMMCSSDHRALLLALFLGFIGCQPQAPAPSATSQAPSDPCANLTDPKVASRADLLVGQVYAPPTKQASLFDALIPQAAASTLPEEQPQVDIPVALVHNTVDFEPAPDQPPIATAKTNAQGQFCLRLPQGKRPGPGLMLVATLPQGQRLRLPAFYPLDLKLASQPEALTQLLAQAKVDALKLPAEVFLNMRTIADTRANLLSQLSAKDRDVTAVIQELRDHLSRDERLSPLIQQWGQRREVGP